MDQFGYRYDRYANLDLALSRLHLFQNFRYGTPSAFGRDDDT
jgi:hypothetical protein